MRRKQWNIAPPCPEEARRLETQLGRSHLAAQVLAARGLCGEDAARFLDSSLDRLGDPFLLPDMDKAVAALEEAIGRGEKIAVYGDYDVDGVTATAILIRYLRSRGAECQYYIPDRMNEGYGLNTGAIRKLAEDGCCLMVTVDSGITAVEETLLAQSLGMGVVITDHHECKEVLPEALAVVNPRRSDSPYPFRELAGVGVAFKLICAMEKGRPLEELMKQYADLVAVGTVADVMPLVGENRSIVHWGLQYLQNTKNPGLRALMQKLGVEDKGVTAGAISFTMAPRINAAGRMGGADKAVELFLTDSCRVAGELAGELCQLNRQRQQEENQIFQEILGRLSSQFDPQRDKSIVLWGENWHNGVVGIVASRLADRYGVPAILISLDGDTGKGSGRSVPGFHLYGGLEECGDLLEKYGGHELAVGLTVQRAHLDEFKSRFEAYAARQMEQNQVQPVLPVDCLVEPGDLTIPAVESLEVLEPFGMGNPQPMFCMRGLTIEEITPISQDRHTKLQLGRDGKSFCAFLFGMGSANCPFVCGDQVDGAFSVEINRYRGRESVQLVLRDLLWSGEEDRADRDFWEVYRIFQEGGALEPRQALGLIPTRQDLVAVFRHVKAHAGEQGLSCSPRTLYRQVRYEACRGMNLGKLLICLDVFQEFDIFSCTRGDEQVDIRVLERKDKADINGSRILKRLAEASKSQG